jgi:hypothetical protein
LYAIVSALAEAVQEKGENAEGLLEAAKDFGWFATVIGSQLVNKNTGIDPIAAGQVAEKKKEERNESIPGIMDAFSIQVPLAGIARKLEVAIFHLCHSELTRRKT